MTGHGSQRDLDVARRVLDSEEAGIRSLRALLDDERFTRALGLLKGCRGRILVSGVGKSGLVAQRIAASLRSTGSRALFLHPTEAVHGDLGLVEEGDVGLFLSKSGESAELNRLLPIWKRIPLELVALTAEPRSTLAREADVALVVGPIEEAPPLRVVPTTSGVVFQALGDMLVTCLYAARGFTESDLAYLHPGGVIGERVTRLVADVMHKGGAVPRVAEGLPLRDAIVEMIAKKLGMTTVVGDDGRLVGILTDGDIRRIVHIHGRVDHLVVEAVMSRHPRTIAREALVASAVQKMESNPSGPITSLVVVDAEGRPEGVVHLHDCLGLGPSV